MNVEDIARDNVIVHTEERVRVNGTIVGSRCACGAHWSHPMGRDEELMTEIFQSHIRYFENKTVVL